MTVVPEGKCLVATLEKKPSKEGSISELKISESAGSVVWANYFIENALTKSRKQILRFIPFS